MTTKRYHIAGFNPSEHYVNIRAREKVTTKQIFMALDLAGYTRTLYMEENPFAIPNEAAYVSRWMEETFNSFCAGEMSDMTWSDEWHPSVISWAMHYWGLIMMGREPKVIVGRRYEELARALDDMAQACQMP